MDTEVFGNVSRQRLIDLAMPLDWLFLARMGVDPDIVATAMAQQLATGVSQPAHKLVAFHRAISRI